jgi:NAD+ kinase
VRAPRPRVLVVVKRTFYEREVLEGKNPLTKKLLARRDPVVRKMLETHRSHVATETEVMRVLGRLGASTFVRKSRRGTPIPSTFDLVITVGGDGTLLSTSHQIDDVVPLLGVNSAPDSSVGFFCAASRSGAEEAIGLALAGKLPRQTLQRMRVTRNAEILSNRVLNEALFCHPSPAATSRYLLRVETEPGVVDDEEQRSSGMWIGPAAGSTAALRSAGGRVLPLRSAMIQFVVREPYRPRGQHFRLQRGLVKPGGSVQVRSKMRAARLFLDGHETWFDVGLGDLLTLESSPEPLHVLGMTRRTA